MSNEANKRFIVQQYREELNEKNINEADKIEEEIDVHLRKHHLKNIEELIEKHCNEYGLELLEVKNFLETLHSDDLIETKDEDPVTQDIRSSTEHALRTKISAKGGEESVVHTKEAISNEDRKKLAEQVYMETGKKAFIISKQQSFDGRISMELSKTRERFRLLTVLKDKDGDKHFQHFGEGNPNKGFNKHDRQTYSFYQYKFQANDKEYIVFSTKKLEPMRCILHGTKVSIADQKDVGDNRKLPTDKEIIFMHSHEPAIKPLEPEALDDMRSIIDREWFMEKMLGDVRHPDWYEDMLAAIFLAKKDNGFPSHLLQMAEPGTGKSLLLNAVRKSMDESSQTFSGQSSTVKGLVPSFKESPPASGYLITCDRLAPVDEIFDLLSNTVKNGDARQQDAFRPLLDLLTHSTREYSSGNGSVVGKTDATMLAVGNPAYGFDSIYDALQHNKIDSAFLSRFLLYDQTDSHIKFIHDRKKKMNKNDDEMLPERSDEFLSLLDTMRMKTGIELDMDKVSGIHDDLSEIVPNVFRVPFNARYDHHLKNMVVGIAKLRYATENRDTLEVRPEDYEDAKNILEMLISSWGDVDMTQLSFNARLNALTHAQREVYEAISKSPGVEGSEFFGELSEEAQSETAWITTHLNKHDLIEIKDENGAKKYYPYWCDEAKEVRVEREDMEEE